VELKPFVRHPFQDDGSVTPCRGPHRPVPSISLGKGPRV
jgi:hypothetical protein